VRRLRSVAGSLAIAVALGAFVFYSNRSVGLTAVIAVVGLTASSAFQGTLQNWVASGQLASEGYVHVGRILVVPGPDGPFVGIVESREPRVTVLRDQAGDATLILPNAMLTTGPLLVLATWPPPVVPPSITSS
jgi:small-conductance mechanosensitive channel